MYTGITADTPRYPPEIFQKGHPWTFPGKPHPQYPPTQNFYSGKPLSRNCKIYFTYPERIFNFPRGFPRRRAFPGRIHGEYGENTGMRRDIPGIPGRGAKPLQIYLPKYALWSSHPEVSHRPDPVPGIPRVIPGAARALHRVRLGRTPRAYRGEPPTLTGSTRPAEPIGSPLADTVWNLHSSIRNLRCSNSPLPATVSTGGRHGRGGERPRPARVPAAACRDASGGPRAGIPPTPCPPGDDPGGERSPPT